MKEREKTLAKFNIQAEDGSTLNKILKFDERSPDNRTLSSKIELIKRQKDVI